MVSGDPIPDVIWYYKGQTIKDDERHEIVKRETLQVLQVKNSLLSDSGEYTVVARNPLGEVNCKAPLVVKGTFSKILVFYSLLIDIFIK